MDPMNATQPTEKRRMHPLVATAAGAVLVASLAATAAVTGLFPKASSNDALNNQTQAAQVSQQPVVGSAQPANPAAYAQQQQAQASAAAPSQQQQYAAQQAPQYAQQPAQPAYCSSCGTVEAISAIRQEGHGTGIGAVGGAVAGGLVGNQFGGGGGRTAMTILGVVGGGLAGNSVERHLRSTTAYSVRVRMESGKARYFTYHDAPPFQQGEHVQIQRGTLVATD